LIARPNLIRCFIVVLAAAPGCTLIDQNTFNPRASAVPVIPPAPVAAAAPAPQQGPPPLLTVQPGQPAQDAVRRAVAAARSRKPDVVFDVVAMVPAGAPFDGKADDQAAASSAEAGAVARAITFQGVAPGRVHLYARPDAALATREVRVYVR